MTADLQNGQSRLVPPPPIAGSHELPMSIGSISLTAVPTNPQGVSIHKMGTLIPNRIFVGGISSNTTEEELKGFFSPFGAIKDVKIIYDKSGLSKGNYGFITFESQETAEAIIKKDAETLIFKDRKLNIGYAVRKQILACRSETRNCKYIYSGTWRVPSHQRNHAVPDLHTRSSHSGHESTFVILPHSSSGFPSSFKS